MLRHPLQFTQPKFIAGITRHAPITSGGKTDRTYFHAVRHAGAFELLGEETFVEHPELIDYRLPIAVLKGVLSQENDLGGAEAEPQDIYRLN